MTDDRDATDDLAAEPSDGVEFDESWAGEGVEPMPGRTEAGRTSDSDAELSESEVDGDPFDTDAADGSDSELADEISGEIVQLVAERDQFKDIAQRLQADFENYRRRMATQRTAEIDRATGALAEALLPVLDAAEAAYVNHPDEVGPLLNLLLAELKKHGLESVDLLGQPFDPNLAEAVAHEPGDGSEPVVTEVLRSGYTWNGRTLRPAMVRTRD